MKIQQWTNKQKVGGKLKLRLWDQACKRSIESRVQKGGVMIVHVLSCWLASSYPIWCAFLQHISWRVSIESAINKLRVLAILHEAMARLLHGCLYILQWYWAWTLSYQSKIISVNIRISLLLLREKVKHADFWNHHNYSLSKVYQFIWSCHVFFY